MKDLSEEEGLMLIMFYYDVWQLAGPKLGFKNLQESLTALKRCPIMLEELLEVVDYLISKIAVVEKPFDIGYSFPLKLHSRYNRDQILAALRLHTFEKASSNREGVAFQKALNTEAFFITLKKSEKEYSPTTLYDDYGVAGAKGAFAGSEDRSRKFGNNQCYVKQYRA